MASHSPQEASAATTTTLDESLAQLEEALDLFVARQGDPVSTLKSAIKNGEHMNGKPMSQDDEGEGSVHPIQDEQSAILALSELKRKAQAASPETIAAWTSASDVVMLPDTEENAPRRRFPLLTEAQKRMIWLAIGLLVFFGLIAALLWWQQQRDEERQARARQQDELYAKPLPTDSAATSPVPVSEPLTDATPISSEDQLLADSIRQILAAYNPTAVGKRYRLDVKDGIVTLSGEAQTQMEKDGAENVIKPLQGIKKVVNNLVVKGLMVAGAGGAVPTGSGALEPVMYPKVNDAEARRLEEALKRDLVEGAKRAEEERHRIEQQNALLRAQQAPDSAAKTPESRPPVNANAEEANLLAQQTAERLRKEREDHERRLEEQRKADLEKVAKPATPAASAELRSGTVSWSGIVKGVDDVVIRGNNAFVSHISGGMGSNARASFSAPLPSLPMGIRLVATSGKMPIRIVQYPSAANNFTTIVRVGEPNKSDEKPHSFTLRWATQ